MLIPRRLHQIWLEGSPPEPYQTLSDRMRAKHSHWEYRLWTKEAFGRLINESIYAQMRAEGQPALACDVLRYEIVARYGGVYVDLDCFAMRALDDLLSHTDLAFAVEEYGWYTNAVFGATPNHPFMWKLVRELPAHFAASRSYEHAPIDWTGPRFITDQILGSAIPVHLIPQPFLMRYRGEPIGPDGFRPTPFDFLVHLWGHQGAEAVSQRAGALAEWAP
jgi:inositol phosphorylceramide mannosyltransferase catalytic subunit